MILLPAGNGPTRAPHAVQTCAICKARKKKCDKLLPSCSYCTRKRRACRYITAPQRHRLSGLDIFQPLAPCLLSHLDPLNSVTSEASIYTQVCRLICLTGQSLDAVKARYFNGIHRHLPIISKDRFHNSLLTLEATPNGCFPVLLLAMCLVTWCPDQTAELATSQRRVDQVAVYLAVKSLFAQVQSLSPPSLELIQAGLLLCMYDYAHSRTDEALATIASCTRMAYAAHLHSLVGYRTPLCLSKTFESSIITGGGSCRDLQVKEAANSWWGIVVCERIILCEATVVQQPLISIIPSGGALLPYEAEALERSDTIHHEIRATDVAVACLESADAGSFGRSAQAAWLLDQVLKALSIPSIGSSISQLQDLDSTIQGFMSTLMDQCQGEKGVCCEAIAINIRSLFMLHRHILDQLLPMAGNIGNNPHEKLRNCSNVALDTALRMVLDIANFHGVKEPYICASLAPSYPHILQAALRYVVEKEEQEKDDWFRGAERTLRLFMEKTKI